MGQAAATWSSTAAPGEEAPSLTEIVHYVRCYEDARGRAFTRDEHRAIGAAVVWLLAYASRCEHAIDPDSELHIRARPRLAPTAPPSSPSPTSSLAASRASLVCRLCRRTPAYQGQLCGGATWRGDFARSLSKV